MEIFINIKYIIKKGGGGEKKKGKNLSREPNLKKGNK